MFGSGRIYLSITALQCCLLPAKRGRRDSGRGRVMSDDAYNGTSTGAAIHIFNIKIHATA
jgi:hypothetical protein